ncbi:MAG: glycosyltransferase [Acidimicrobiales bacterium]
MRVLFATLENHGYATMASYLARRLDEAGHQVAVATGHRARWLFTGGAQIVPAGAGDVKTFVTQEWADVIGNALQYKHVELALRSFPADLVVTSELTFGAAVAAARFGLPVVTMGSVVWRYPTAQESGSPLGHRLERLRAYHLTEAQHIYDLVRAGLGETSHDNRPYRFLGDRYLLRAGDRLRPELADDVDERVRCAGAMMPPPVGTPGRTVAGGRSRVLVTLARTFGEFDPWHDMVDPLVAGDRFALDILPGRAEAVGCPGATHGPETGITVLPALAPDGFFDYRAAVLTGTSWQTVCALRAGLPVVFHPAGAEQPVVALDLHRRGLGRVVERRPVHPADLLATIDLRTERCVGVSDELRVDTDPEVITGGWS